MTVNFINNNRVRDFLVVLKTYCFLLLNWVVVSLPHSPFPFSILTIQTYILCRKLSLKRWKKRTNCERHKTINTKSKQSLKKGETWWSFCENLKRKLTFLKHTLEIVLPCTNDKRATATDVLYWRLNCLRLASVSIYCFFCIVSECRY